MQKFQRKWPAKDFVDRWFLQTNYPTLMVSLKYDSIKQSQYLEVIQNRHVNNINDDAFIYDVSSLYPTSFE